jgi:hypothetical protein
MEFLVKFAMAVPEGLAGWQDLNLITFLVAGIIGDVPESIGADYWDAR